MIQNKSERRKKTKIKKRKRPSADALSALSVVFFFFPLYCARRKKTILKKKQKTERLSATGRAVRSAVSFPLCLRMTFCWTLRGRSGCDGPGGLLLAPREPTCGDTDGAKKRGPTKSPPKTKQIHDRRAQQRAATGQTADKKKCPVVLPPSQWRPQQSLALLVDRLVVTYD